MENCWQAVEAIGTVCMAFFTVWILLVEMPKIKRESASKKVESVEYALDHLGIGGFIGQDYQDIITAWQSRSTKYPQFYQEDLVSLFYRLDYIGLLIKLGYVDKNLLFYEEADTLYNLERAITNLEHRENSQIPSLKKSFPRGYKLLKKAARYIRRKNCRISLGLW